MINRVFQPVNGAEVKEMILSEIRKELEIDTDFRQQVCYPRVEFRFILELKCVERIPQLLEKEIQGSIVTVDSQRKELPEQPGDVAVGKIIRKGKNISVPDRARMGAGLPVNVPQQIPGVGIVEVPTRDGRGAVVKTRASEGFTG